MVQNTSLLMVHMMKQIELQHKLVIERVLVLSTLICVHTMLKDLKTLGYEVAEQLDWNVPNHLIVPTGSGAMLKCNLQRI